MNHSREQGKETITFTGFAAPTSNTTYTPNQFFDVCLPYRSRGCVRIVAYMLRKTLGWSDANGDPLREQFTFTYDELNREAGLSRQMIKPALEEAIQFGFIRCLKAPASNRSGIRASSGLYELRWDETSQYIKDPSEFRGFFAGDGNRTYIPNQFFDVVIRHEALMITKVVGSVARFSIGFTTKWGHRRQHASISLTDIQRYAKIVNRPKLVNALVVAVNSNYLVKVDSGFFDRNGGKSSRSSIYALKWLNNNADSMNGQKRIPETKSPNKRSEKETGNGLKRIPGERSKKDTGLQITNTNNNLKQQRVETKSTDGNSTESVAACFETLKREGFDASTAQRFAKAYPIQRVLNQIEWLPLRGASRNRLGLLRRAIEQDWPKPSTVNRTGKVGGDSQYGQPYWNDVDESRRRLAYKLKLPNQ